MKIKFKQIKKRVKLVFFNPKMYPSPRSKKELRLIQRNPFGDTDLDGVPNFFDCKPLNRKKQGYVYYHGTTKKALKKIMKEGLIPASEVFTETKPYTKKLTYATTDIDQAKERGGAGKFKNHVILKIKSEKEYPTEGEFIGISYGNPKTFAITDTISPEKLEVVDNLKDELKEDLKD